MVVLGRFLDRQQPAHWTTLQICSQEQLRLIDHRPPTTWYHAAVLWFLFSPELSATISVLHPKRLALLELSVTGRPAMLCVSLRFHWSRPVLSYEQCIVFLFWILHSGTQGIQK